MKTLQIDFVSDIACPWCVIGLYSLETALERLRAEGIAAEIHFQPFELNPQMGPEGQDVVEHLGKKYGINAEQIAQNQAAIRERGAQLGFAFGKRERISNTFDAHRLLHAAGLQGPEVQRKLKHALMQAYHGEGKDPGDPALLLRLAAEAGLQDAEAVVNSRAHTEAVRAAEQLWQTSGIRAVPAVVVNRSHLISGGQPPEVFEQALRQLAQQQA